MAGVFVYVGTARIKPGKLEEARKNLAELVDFGGDSRVVDERSGKDDAGGGDGTEDPFGEAD